MLSKKDGVPSGTLVLCPLSRYAIFPTVKVEEVRLLTKGDRMSNKLLELIVNILLVGIVIFGVLGLASVLLSLGPLGVIIGIGVGWWAIKTAKEKAS